MPTIGLLSVMDPVEPKNGVVAGKEKIPPSEAESQYPAVCTPRPSSAPDCGLPVPLSVNKMAACLTPSADGLKTIPTVQKALTATDAPVQVSEPGAIEKSPAAVPVIITELTVMVPGPAFTSATERRVLVTPIASL